jgi:NitT/TauT family transport system substrate-binding protein
MPSRRTFQTIIVAAAVAFAASGPVSAQSTEFTVQLAWLPNAATAGEIVALRNGYFEEAGLDVTLLPGGPGANPIQELLSGTAEVSLGYAPQIMYAAERGLPVTSFAASFQKAPLSFVSLGESNITSVSDWTGKRVGAAQSAIPQIKAVLHHNNMAFEDITFVQAQVPALLQGQVDVVATWPTNVAQNKPIIDHPGGSNDQAIWDNGLQFQSNYYIARKETIANAPDQLAAFLEAVDRGWAFAVDNPEETVEILVSYAPALEADKELASLQVIVDSYIYSDETAAHGFGHISTDRWQQTLDTYVAIGEIGSDVTAEDVFDASVLEATNRTHR